MSDPAVEAAKRATNAPDDFPFPSGPVEAFALSAAREALKPLRELHFEHKRVGQWEWVCKCGRIWPCDTAKLIYSSEELER